jgi:hypothetical protein
VSVMWWLLVTSLVLVTVESVSAESVRRSDDPLRADWSRRTVLPLGALMIGSVGALTGAAFLLYPPALAVLLLGTAGGVLAVTILGCAVWRWLHPVASTAPSLSSPLHSYRECPLSSK